MSTLASISVRNCDVCKRIVVLKSDAEYTTFEKTWYDGFAKHVCDLCLSSDAGKEVIASDTAEQKAFSQVIRKYSRVERSSDYAH